MINHIKRPFDPRFWPKLPQNGVKWPPNDGQMTRVVRRYQMYLINMLFVSKMSIFCLFKLKTRFGEFRGHFRNGSFYPRKGHIFKIRYFITSANEIVRLLQKKWNDFLNFYGNGEQNGKPIFTFFTVVLKFHVRVSSSPCQGYTPSN